MLDVRRRVGEGAQENTRTAILRDGRVYRLAIQAYKALWCENTETGCLPAGVAELPAWGTGFGFIMNESPTS